MKRLISLVLALATVSVLPMLAGCGRDGEKRDITSETTAAETPGGTGNNNSNTEVKSMAREIINFNTGWLYSPADYKNGSAPELDDSTFEAVSVPHANTLLTDHKGPNFGAQIESYRFVSWYRRHFSLGSEYDGRRVAVEFEGVATVADVYVNGTLVGTHKGAYTGFTYDITDQLREGDNVIAVRVDSERQPDIPPEGGPVDYCVFGGIVRDVKLIVTSPVYIADAFITTPELSSDSGKVSALVTVTNGSAGELSLTVASTVTDADGKTAAEFSGTKTVGAGETAEFENVSDAIARPHLWSTDDPYLYTVKTTVSVGGNTVDDVTSRLGFRTFSFEDDGFYLNGVKTEIVGINRHEQWPWIGRAVPDRQQRADADLIKDTGFNAVRCSHYPQDPSFLERCDEIGLIVFEEAPGWQFIGGDEWQTVYRENIREMILRDRNHASIVSWGTRVNESFDNDALYTETNKIAKELDPTRPTHGVRRAESYGDTHFLDGEDIFTVNYTYPDKPRHSPFIITEHSMDWYNGRGLSEATDTDALTFTKSFAEVVDYYFGSEYCLGGFAWSMFDYDNEVNYTNTDNVFYSGLYNIFRIPKMASYFYRSQKDPSTSPMVYIANYRTPSSPSTVTVFSNCDEVELFAGGISVGRQTPSLYTDLPHPVYEFKNVPKDGELKVVGYIDGVEAASFTVKAPGEPVKLILKPQFNTLTADGSDFTSVEIYAVDENGAVVPYAKNEVTIAVTGNGRFIGEQTISLEGGSAAFLIQSAYGKTGSVTATVTSDGMESTTCEIKVEAFGEKTVPVSDGKGTAAPEILTHRDINDGDAGVIADHFDYVGGGWTSGPQSGCYFLDNHYSRTAGDSVTVRFNGGRFLWYGTTAPNHGILTISVDGGAESEIDCYSADRCDSIVLFDSGDLGEGDHTVTVRVTGRKNAASTDTYINVDRIRIFGGTVADTSGQKEYSFPSDTVKSGGHENNGSTYEWWVSTVPHLFYVDTLDAEEIAKLTVRYGYELGDAELAVYAYDNGGEPLTADDLKALIADPARLGDPIAVVGTNSSKQWSYGTVTVSHDGIEFIEGADSFSVLDGSSPLDMDGKTGRLALIVALTGSIGSGAYFDYMIVE